MSVGGHDDTIANAAPTVAAAGLPDGTELVANRYRVLRWLGGGGMGRVYEVLDTELDERIALKMLRTGLSEDAIERFRREVKLTRRIQHKNVARMFDIGDHAGHKFLTMELVEGRSLTKELGAVMDWPRLRSIAVQICAGLSAAHDAGVVHRDLKPDNVMIEQTTDRVVITDFGIARSGDDVSVTQVGAIIGTPRYMAPEQLAGRAIDQRADLFALGVMLFELATGTRPWAGDNAITIAVAQATQAPRPIAVAHIPATFAALIEQCMALDPERRPRSAAVIGEAIASGVGIAPPMPDITDTVTVFAKPIPAAPTTASQPGETTVAVLPVTSAPEDAYLADGLLDDLVDTLSSTGTLRVRPAGMVREKLGADPRELGRQLEVDHVVIVSLRRTPTKLRVLARLISVADGFQIWAHRDDCTEAEILDIAEHLGRGIATALSARWTGGTRPTDPRAVDLYLRARAELRRFWGPHAQAAADLLEEAATFAPTSPPIVGALAYAAVQAWIMRGAPELAHRAREALERGLACGHGEAFLASATFKLNQGELETGATDLAIALIRAPMSAQAHETAGRILIELGAVAEGRHHLDTALGLDPGRANVIEAELARLDGLHGDWSAALGRAARLVADPDPSIQLLGAICDARLAGWRRDRAAMLAATKRFGPQLGQYPTRTLMFLGAQLTSGIDPTAWEQVLAIPREPDRPTRQQILAFQIMAEVALVLDQEELSLKALRRATDLGLIDITWLDGCPLFARTDLRWHTIRDEVARRSERVLLAFRSTRG